MWSKSQKLVQTLMVTSQRQSDGHYFEFIQPTKISSLIITVWKEQAISMAEHVVPITVVSDLVRPIIQRCSTHSLAVFTQITRALW